MQNSTKKDLISAIILKNSTFFLFFSGFGAGNWREIGENCAQTRACVHWVRRNSGGFVNWRKGHAYYLATRQRESREIGDMRVLESHS